MEEQVTDLEEEVIITNNNLLFQFSVHNKDLLVLKQWKSTWPVCRKYTFVPTRCYNVVADCASY